MDAQLSQPTSPSHNQPAAADYPAIFRQYILRSAAASLAALEQTGAVLTDDDRAQALHNLAYALRLADRPEAWPTASHLLLRLAPKMEQAGHRNDWIGFLESGIGRSQQQDDTAAETDLRFYLGVLRQLLSEYDAAHQQFTASAGLAQALGDAARQGRAQNRLAYVARLQRRLEEAGRLAAATLDLLPDDDRERAYSFFVLGCVALDGRRWEEAADAYRRSLALWEKTGDQRMIAWGLTNLGPALRAQGNYAEASACYRRAIALFEAIHDPVHHAVAQMNLGLILDLTGQPAAAVELYLPAERVFRQTQDRLRLAAINNNLGLAYRQLGRWDEARTAFLASIELWQRVGNVLAAANVMDGLGMGYLEQGLAVEAARTFEDTLHVLALAGGQPGYAPLVDEVLGHLAEARAAAGHLA